MLSLRWSSLGLGCSVLFVAVWRCRTVIRGCLMRFVVWPLSGGLRCICRGRLRLMLGRSRLRLLRGLLRRRSGWSCWGCRISRLIVRWRNVGGCRGGDWWKVRVVALTAAGTVLAREHRVATSALADIVFRRVVRASDALEGRPVWVVREGLLDEAVPLVSEFSDGAAALSMDFYESSREAAGVSGRFTPPPAPVPPVEQTEGTIRYMV